MSIALLAGAAIVALSALVLVGTKPHHTPEEIGATIGVVLLDTFLVVVMIMAAVKL